MKEEKPKIGSGTAGAKLTLPESPENNVRFASFLRAFSVTRENRHVNDADFSYSWYAYGMEHYDGVALVEPLEYSEERKTPGACDRDRHLSLLLAGDDELVSARGA